MTDAPLCVVCSKPILPSERPLSGEDVHTACDRRTRLPQSAAVKCIVCNEPIRSRTGSPGSVTCWFTALLRARPPPEHRVTAPNGTAPRGKPLGAQAPASSLRFAHHGR